MGKNEFQLSRLFLGFASTCIRRIPDPEFLDPAVRTRILPDSDSSSVIPRL